MPDTIRLETEQMLDMVDMIARATRQPLVKATDLADDLGRSKRYVLQKCTRRGVPLRDDTWAIVDRSSACEKYVLYLEWKRGDMLPPQTVRRLQREAA